MSRASWLSGLLVMGAVAAAAAQAPGPRPRSKAPATRPAAAPPPRVERAVPFAAGETLSYDISWSSFLTAGTATVTVVDKRPSFDSTAYTIVAEGRPVSLVAALYPLYYRVDALLDAFTLLPQRESLLSREGRRQRTRTMRFHPESGTADLEIQTRTLVQRQLKLPPGTVDPLSALYVLRALPLRAGLTSGLVVADGEDLYRVQVAVRGREAVPMPQGSLTAWRVVLTIASGTPEMKGRSLTVWLGDEARHTPVRMTADLPVGQFVLTLRDAQGAK